MTTGAIFPVGVFPTGLFAGFPGISTTMATYPSISYSEENQLFQQFTGETVKWPFQMLDSSGVVVEALSSPVVYVKVNN